MIGVVASTGSLRIWIVDNHIHNIGGDSVRVGTNPPAPEPRAQFLYIGRNEFHNNGENAIDVKAMSRRHRVRKPDVQPQGVGVIVG